MYKFFPKAMCEFLSIPLFDFDDFDKDYDMDALATELFDIDSKRSEKKTLKVSELTLKYAGLHKVAMQTGGLLPITPLFQKTLLAFCLMLVHG